MKTLWHFSEDKSITEFVPRPTAGKADATPVVWAIDDEHSPLYFFPRDCPRVAFWATPRTTVADKERFLGLTTAKWVIAIESGWLERLRYTTLYRYALPDDDFVPMYDIGMHLARRTVVPRAAEPVGDLVYALRDAGVELRITPSLWPLHDALLDATLHFSMIRMRNAAPRPEGQIAK
jgi:hypothetical protein